MRKSLLFVVILCFVTHFVNAQELQIMGQVSSDSGESLPGVNVVIKGTTQGTVTNMEGKYSILVKDNATLVFTFIGFLSQEVEVNNQKQIDVVLQTDYIGLEEVVSVGYGTMIKKDLTGSVSSVQSEELVKVTSTNIGQAMQGRMAGVQVTQSSGKPGAGAVVRIRGVGSVKSGNGPLVLVDGFPGSLNNIDANNIESLSVLKDAASAAIYGARAANGVILITTKRGKEGVLNVTFKAEYGIQSATHLPDLLNGPDWAQRYNEGRIYNGDAPYWVGAQSPESITEWINLAEEAFGSAPIQNYHVGLNGGNDKTKYSVGLGYIKQDGIMTGADFDNYERFNLRFNFDQKITNKIRAGLNINVNKSVYKTSAKYSAVFIQIFRSAPTIPLYNPDGGYGFARPDYPGEQHNRDVPAAALTAFDKIDKNNQTEGTLFLEFDILPGLQYKLLTNANLVDGWSQNWQDEWYAYAPDDTEHTTPLNSNATNSLSNSDSKRFSWEIQNLFTYKKEFGAHGIDALLGFSTFKGVNTRFNATRQEFPNNNLRVLSAGNLMSAIGGSQGESMLASQFARINYNYNDKYLLQANVRRDGSSVFAPGKHYGVFPSVSVGWRISEESFLASSSFIDNLKLRGGIGQLGNAAIPAYAWVNTLKVNGGAIMGDPQTRYPAFYSEQMTNEDVKWETTTTYGVGVDFSTLGNKLSFTGDIYMKSTTDMLLNASIPLTAGFKKGPVVNIGEVRNTGWELMVNYSDKAGDFSYGVSFNISHNENEVVDLGDVKPWVSKGLKVDEGLPINAYWGYKTDGIWMTWDEIDNNPHRSGNIKPGMTKHLDINGFDDDGNLTGEPDGKINDADKTYMGSSIPKFYYGFNVDMGYKGFDFSIFFQGEADKNLLWESVFGGNGEGITSNTTYSFFDNRAIIGDDGNVISGTTPAMGAVRDGDKLWHDFQIQDASYLRIKNLQIGYTLPKAALQAINIQTLRIYLSATNPFTWTDYQGYDPEMTNSYTRGITGNYPVSKSWSIGINLTF